MMEPLILYDLRARLACVPVPKCAMTSVLAAWEAFWRLPPEHLHLRPWPWVMLSRQDLFNAPYLHRFAVWRDPRDRLLSLWTDKLCEPPYWKADALRIDNPQLAPLIGSSFEEFVRTVCEEIVLGQDATDRHIQPQSWFVMHEGRLIVDQLLRFDDLEAQWQPLRQRGMPYLLWHNASVHEPWPNYYTDELDAMVRCTYAEDFALGDLAGGLP